MRYLLVFHAKLTTHIAEVVREVEVSSADELRGAIELIGTEISEARGVCFLCDAIEVPEEGIEE